MRPIGPPRASPPAYHSYCSHLEWGLDVSSPWHASHPKKRSSAPFCPAVAAAHRAAGQLHASRGGARCTLLDSGAAKPTRVRARHLKQAALDNFPPTALVVLTVAAFEVACGAARRHLVVCLSLQPCAPEKTSSVCQGLPLRRLQSLSAEVTVTVEEFAALPTFFATASFAMTLGAVRPALAVATVTRVSLPHTSRRQPQQHYYQQQQQQQRMTRTKMFGLRLLLPCLLHNGNK